MAKLESCHFWFLGRRDILEHILNIGGVTSGDAKLQILDAGCGTGGNLDWLNKYGQAWGVDGSPYACTYSAEKHAGHVVRGTLPDGLPFCEESFDLITLLDVLEHLDDDIAALQKLSSLLKPGGHLLVSVPAFAHLWSGHDVSHQHKRRYIKTDLQDVLLRSGFVVDFIGYFNTHLYPLIAVKRILNRILKKDGGDLAMPPKALNCILYKIFSCERLWLGKIPIPFGVSIGALVHRKKACYELKHPQVENSAVS